MTELRERTGAGAGESLSLARALLAFVLVSISSLAGAGSSALAQTSTTGAISGHVLDRSGHAWAAKELTITDPARGSCTSIRTDESGRFFAHSLAPSEYTIGITEPGLKSSSFSHVVVQVGSTADVTITLAPASLSTEVTVSSEAPGDLDDPPAASSTVINEREIAELPTDGRRWQSFAQLTPQANPAPSPDGVGLLSFRGLAPTQNASRIDGADDDQSFSGTPHGSGTESGTETEEESESEGHSPSSSSGRGFSSGSGTGRRPGAAYTFSQAAVREFRVAGQNYSSLYGHGAAAIITTVSKSGSQELHGSAFLLIRDSAWAASDPFSIASHYSDGVITSSVVKPPDHRQQFGGSIGGPLFPHHLTTRLFYFYALDVQRRSFPAISSPENPAFYALTATQRALLQTRGVSSAKTNAALNYLDSLTGTVPRRADQEINFLKLDSQLNPRHHLSTQYSRSRFTSPAGIRSAAVVNRGRASFGEQTISLDSVLARWLYSHGNAFSNELRSYYNHDLHSERAETPLSQEPAISLGGLSPEIAIGPQGLNFGTPSSIGKRAAPDEHRVQVADVASVASGQHLLQTGFEWSYIRDSTDSLANSAGTFHYDSGSTGGRAGGLVDWITDYTFNVRTYPNGGCPSIGSTIHDFCFRSFSQSFGGQTSSFSTQEFAGFLQERWRAASTLSITAGLRYEYELLPIPQNPNSAVDAIFAPRSATSIFPEDRNNFGPRLAVSWQPFGERHGTVRAAYGVYFGRVPGATVRSALVDTAMASSATRIRILPSTITACPQVANQGFGYPCAFTSAPSGSLGSTASVMAFDRHFRTPTVQQGSFSLERDLGHAVSVSASYLINLNHQLPNSVDMNIAPSTGTRTFQLQGGTEHLGVRNGDRFVLPIYTRRLTDSFGPVTAITSNANATYHAMVLEARRRNRDGLEFRASWTWSKAIDFGQNSGSVPRTNGQLDPFNILYDKSLSSMNFPHKVVVSAIWQPAFTSASRRLQHLGSGWTVASVLTESSGRPYSYNTFGGTRLTGGHESINGSGGDVYLPTVGRNTLRLPDAFNLDLRLSRDLAISEKVKLQGSAEVFNASNHVNYAVSTERAFLVGPASNGVTPLIFQDAATIASQGGNTQPFGSLTSSSGEAARERQIQFGLHIAF